MNLQNLSQSTGSDKNFSLAAVVIVIALALAAGFWGSRLFPRQSISVVGEKKSITSPIENIKEKSDLQIGKVYGKTGKNFKDTAIGVIEKGSINGEGTHILNREGGASQRASLTSSVVDLDLFVGKKVEVKGETNASNKTAWLLDVGSIKILE